MISAIRRLWHWWPWDRRQTGGTALVLLGIALAVGAVLLATAGPSGQALLVLASALCQIGAAWLFNGRRQVPESHAHRALARLFRLRERAAEAREEAEALAEATRKEDTGATAEWGRATFGLSLRMSYVQEDVIEAVEDWATAMPWVARTFNPCGTELRRMINES